MRDFVRKPRNWVVVMIVIAFLIALIITFASSLNTNLPSYNGPATGIEPSNEPAVTSEPSIATKMHSSKDPEFTMAVPADWVYVVQDGNDEYVNTSDGAAITFHVSDYSPAVNTTTADSFSADVVEAGGTLNNFLALSDTSLIALYEIGSLDYFEYIIWDRNTLINVLVRVPAQSYTSYYDVVLELLDTFQWTPSNPFPEGYDVYYSEYGNFEFCIPADWNYTMENGVLIGSSQTGQAVQVSLSDGGKSLAEISQIDYVDIMGVSKQNYLLSSFQNNGSNIVTTSTFTQDSVTYIALHTIFESGQFWYEFYMQAPLDTEASTVECFNIITNSFRAF